MNAKEMFEKLGYTQVRCDDDYIIYEKPIDDGANKRVLDFGDQNRALWVHYDFQHGEQVPSIHANELAAINKQFEELGWMED